MSPKVLLIDDEPDLVQFQKLFLMRRNYRVTTASNTSEAIEKIKKESPDVVFCDIRLDSDSAGLDILEQAKKIKPDIVVYFVTGLVDKNLEEKSLALGASGFLIKPISNEALESKIKEVIPYKK